MRQEHRVRMSSAAWHAYLAPPPPRVPGSPLGENPAAALLRIFARSPKARPVGCFSLLTNGYDAELQSIQLIEAVAVEVLTPKSWQKLNAGLVPSCDGCVSSSVAASVVCKTVLVASSAGSYHHLQGTIPLSHFCRGSSIEMSCAITWICMDMSCAMDGA